MLLVQLSDDTIRQRLADELASVENRFVTELHSGLPCVNELVRHIQRYRGKRLRPMLVLVAGLASSPDGRPLTDAHRGLATVVEMIHMATLVHDDILDDAEVRRSGPTVNFLRGNETAVMLGDYLISHAYHLCSNLERPWLCRAVAATTNVVCEGELLQLSNRENWDLDETTYFDIIRRKTASLCGACCGLAAELHEADDQVVHSLQVYGEKLGLAFQIIDDLLDLTGDEDTVGKTLGRDLQKSKLTLPLIHHLRLADPAERAKFLELLRRHSRLQVPDPELSRALRQALRNSGSVQYGNRFAESTIKDAKNALAVLPDSAARDLLLEMADAVLTRKF